MSTQRKSLSTILTKSLLGQFGAGCWWRMLSEEIQQWWIKCKQETRKWTEILMPDEHLWGLGQDQSKQVLQQGCFSLLLLLRWMPVRSTLGEERAYCAYIFSHNPSLREVRSTTQSRNLKAGLLATLYIITSNPRIHSTVKSAGTMEGAACWLIRRLVVCQLSYTIQDHLGNGASHSGSAPHRHSNMTIRCRHFFT